MASEAKCFVSRGVLSRSGGEGPGDNKRKRSMHVHVELPEDIAQAMIADGQDLTRAAEQSIALEGYRSGRLSQEQVRRLLGFESRLQVHAFLKAHQVYLNYT